MSIVKADNSFRVNKFKPSLSDTKIIKIKTLLLWNGLTINDMAKELGISRVRVSNIIHGKVSSETPTAIKVNKALRGLNPKGGDSYGCGYESKSGGGGRACRHKEDGL